MTIVGLVLSGCGSSESSRQMTVDREIAALAPLKAGSENTIVGMDVKDNTELVLSLDVEAWTSIDEDDDTAIEALALKDWKAAWIHEHPGLHAILHVRFVDYHGSPVYNERTTV